MNEEYLWDKSGEPDPQIQELEEILAPLRYQPKPLEIPNELLVARRRSHLPLLAIAATVLIALLATGVWLRVRTASSTRQEQTEAQPLTPPASKESASSDVAKNTVPEKTIASPNKPLRKNRSTSSNTILARYEREEALAAKEQVMLALRLASEKLKLAHRKTQGPASPNQIKNQHKVG